MSKIKRLENEDIYYLADLLSKNKQINRDASLLFGKFANQKNVAGKYVDGLPCILDNSINLNDLKKQEKTDG